LDKSPSLRAITHDFNKLAQAVKDDWGPKPLVRANNRAVQKELIAGGVNFHKSRVWKDFLVFWKTVKKKMEDSDEYRRWLESSAEESRRMNAVATAIVPATVSVSAAPTSNAAPSPALEQEDFASKVAEKVATTLEENNNKFEATEQTLCNKLSEQESMAKSVYEFVTTPGPVSPLSLFITIAMHTHIHIHTYYDDESHHFLPLPLEYFPTVAEETRWY
jgi:hypothetical protein